MIVFIIVNTTLSTIVIVKISLSLSPSTVLFQQLECAFSRQTFLQGCFIKCEILRSPMMSYRSLLYIATAMYDKDRGINAHFISTVLMILTLLVSHCHH